MTGRPLWLRRDLAAQMATVVPPTGEPFYVTDTGDFGVGDGASFGDELDILFSKKTHVHNATETIFTPAGTLRSTTSAAALDALAGRLPQVKARTTAAPPVSPAVGDNYIVPSGASGDWSGHAGDIATCTAVTPTWTFTTPAAGQYVICDEDQSLWRYSGSAWQSAGLTLFNRGEISPTQLSADVNDYAPTGIGAVAILRLTSNASRSITGILAGTAGRVLKLLNVGSNNIVLSDADAGSTAANRFSFGASITLKAGESAVVWYDTTQSRWALLARSFVQITELPVDIALPGDISPAQITASQNDYNPTGLATASCLLINADAARSITGVQGGRRGRLLKFFNTGAFAITFANASASSTAANRFAMSSDVVLGQYQSATFRYDTNSSRWMLVAQTAGGAVADGAVGPNSLSSDDAGLRAKIFAAPFEAAACVNMAVNGDHIISQENADTAVTSIGSAGGVETYITDQFKIRAKGSLRVSGARITTIGLPGIKYALRTTITTSQSSLGSGDYLQVSQPIEGLRTARLGLGAAGGQAIAIGVYVRASITGTFAVQLANSARDRSITKLVTIASANTWTWVPFAGTPGAGATAFPGDTTGTWLTDTGVGLRVAVTLAAGSSLQGTADAWAAADVMTTSGQTNLAATGSATFDVTALCAFGGIELPQASHVPNLMRSYIDELRQAQRYYFRRSYVATGDVIGHVHAYASNSILGKLLDLPVEMCATPAGGVSSIGHLSTYTAAGGAGGSPGSGTLDQCTPTTIGTTNLAGGSLSGLTAGQVATVFFNSSSGWIAANARLS